MNRFLQHVLSLSQEEYAQKHFEGLIPGYGQILWQSVKGAQNNITLQIFVSLLNLQYLKNFYNKESSEIKLSVAFVIINLIDVVQTSDKLQRASPRKSCWAKFNICIEQQMQFRKLYAKSRQMKPSYMVE